MHSPAGKGPSGEGPRREFRALTCTGQRHDEEWAEKDLQGGNTGGGVTASPFGCEFCDGDLSKPDISDQGFDDRPAEGALSSIT